MSLWNSLTSDDTTRDQQRRSRTSGISNDDRGQSYAVGFIIILSVAIIGGLGLFTLGVSFLSEAPGQSGIASAQSNMKNLRADFNELASDGAPYREIEMQATNGKLTYGDTTTIKINATGTDVDLTGSDAFTETHQTIIYDLPEENTQFVYSAGLIAQEYDSQDAEVRLRKSPNFITSDTRTLFVLPTTQYANGTASSVGISGSGKTYVLGTRDSASVVKRFTSDGSLMTGSVTVSDVPTRRTDAWAKYFRNAGFSNVTKIDQDGDGQADGVTADFSTKRLYIQQALISVSLNEQT